MVNILFIGINEDSYTLIDRLSTIKDVKVIAVVEHMDDCTFYKELVKNKSVLLDTSLEKWKEKKVDVVVNCNTTTEPLSHFISTPILVEGESIRLLRSIIEERTEQIRTVKEKEVTLSLVLNHILDGVIVVDENENILYINKQAEKVVQFKNEKILGKPLKDFFPVHYFRNVLQTRREINHETVQLNSGQEVVSSFIPIINKDHYLVGALGIITEMSKATLLADHLTNISGLTKTLGIVTTYSKDGIHIVDEHGHPIIINNVFKRLFKDGEELLINLHNQVIQSRRPKLHLEVELGHIKVDCSIYPIISDGKIRGSVAVIHDDSKIDELNDRLERSNQIIRQLEANFVFSDIIGQSSRIKIAIDQAKFSAKTSATILLRGEQGTEKNLFAQAIHNESDRRHHKFIRLSCIHKSEGELSKLIFGCDDSITTHKSLINNTGVLERANKGTVLLEHIDLLPLQLQNKLLHYLESGTIKRVGGTTDILLNTRIVATTSASTEEMSKIKEELYYRINQLTIYIPPLRERKTDIPILINHFLTRFNEQYGKNVCSISNEALEKLMDYNWPNNLKELEHVLSYIFMNIEVNNTEVSISDLPNEKYEVSDNLTNNLNAKSNDLQSAMDKFEKQFIKRVYESYNKNKTQTAKALNISIRNLYYKINKYDIE